MKIKSIEICGFKSFPEKTLFNFDSPITAVVGPNGCGKSNVVDAVKWVIGETSMKELRGSLMEDCIFVGSELRQPLNMAEVTLTLSNAEGKGPEFIGNASEISVKRRFFRDADSEYMINNTQCRLKDITDIFIDSGVGLETYSIIEQGSVERIVSSKPEEKRLIIEEAAGITKYKSRKNSALRKMDSTRQNLLRVNDIISEIKRQVGSITRQAKKAERYKVLKEELDQMQLLLNIKSFKDVFDDIESARSSETPLKDNLQARNSQISKMESEVEALKLAVVDHESELARENEIIFEKSSQVHKIESSIELSKSEKESLNNLKISRGSEIENLVQRISNLESEIERKENEKTEAKNLCSQTQEKINGFSSEIGDLKAKFSNSRQNEENLKNEIFSIANQIAQANNNISNIDRTSREITVRLERLSREKSEISELKEKIDNESRDFVQSQDDIKQKKSNLEQNLQTKSAEISSVSRMRNQSEKHLNESSLKLEEARARLNALEEYESQMKDLETPMKELLKDENKELFSDNINLIADVFRVKQGYEVAVQAALGRRLRGVIVESGKTKFDVLKHIKNNNLLRNAVIDNSPRKLNDHSEPSVDLEGYQGQLNKFVEPLSGYESSSEVLFSEFLVFSDLDSAYKFFENNPTRYSLVTVDGDLIEPSGFVESGKFAGLGGGIFERRHEITDKKLFIETLGNEISGLELKIKEYEERLETLENEAQSLRQDIHICDLKITETDKDIDRLKFEIIENNRRREVLDNELSENTSRLESLKQEDIQNRQSLEDNNTRKLSFETELESAKTHSFDLQSSIEHQSLDLSDTKSELATLIERSEGLSRDVENLKNQINTHKTDISQKQDEISSASDKMLSLEKEIEDKRTLAEKGVAELDLLKQDIEKKRAEFARERDKITEAENNLKAEKSLALEIQNQINELQMKIRELEVKSQMLLEQVKTTYGINLETDLESLKEKIPPDDQIEEMRKKTMDLKEKVDSLGDVNIGAIEELKELEERQEFLIKQKEDLENTLINLDKMIKRINQTSKKRFREAFDVINEKFKEVFPKLFEGGRAYLKLTDEEDILESGIDIVAQPKGTKLQNINLLSGGQKALTAIALLIAIFIHKPSPFCILDEVDAPLDDANVLRFIDIVKELSKISQFILITHNKVTMEVADSLYGITMEEKGVSKVVSVKFSDDRQRKKLEATIAA